MPVVPVSERIRRAEKYLAAMGSAGPHEHDLHAYKACKVGLGFDLAETEFWPVLSAWNAGTASPRDERELQGKLASAYRRTRSAPGWLLQGDTARSAESPTPPRRRVVSVYPPQAEVLALWERARPVPEVPEVASWLEARGIVYSNLGTHPAFALRALPRRAVLDPWPAWACYGRRRDDSPRPWHEGGYQIVTPLFDTNGQLRSLRARWTSADAPPNGAKSIPARDFDSSGLFMASLTALRALHEQRWPFDDFKYRETIAHPGGAVTHTSGFEWRAELRFVEGEPDLWSTIQRIHESQAPGRGVIGFYNGSITVDLLRRIPPGTAVIYDGHADKAGDDYLEGLRRQVASTGLAAVWQTKRITLARAVRT